MYEHFPVFNAGLSSSYDGWAKCKEKVTDVSDPNQSWNKKPLQTQVYIIQRFIYQKGAEKLVKDEYM